MKDFLHYISKRSFKELLTIRFFIERPMFRSKINKYDCMFGYTFRLDGENERCMNWWTFVRVPKFIGKLFEDKKN